MYLRHHDAFTIPELKQAFIDSWDGTNSKMGKIECYEVTMAADVKEWLRPHLDKRLHHHTNAHQYVFKKEIHHGVDKVVMSAAQFASSPPEWWTTVGSVLQVHGNPTHSSNCHDSKSNLSFYPNLV